MAVLSGHTHYVMTAFFHPTDDLIISCSLDESVRIWDFKEMKRKYSGGSHGSSSLPPGEMYGATDVTVSIILDYHDKPVNWADFDFKKRLCVSSADDRLIKVTRYSDTRAWEFCTLRGHAHNVISVTFLPNIPSLVLSCGEDKTVRVWEYNSGKEIGIYQANTDRFWIVKPHPTQNYFAAGSDSGMILFKLESERIPFDIAWNLVVYIRKHEIYVRELSGEKKRILCPVQNSQNPSKRISDNYPRYLYSNKFDNSTKSVILNHFEEGTGSYIYEIYTFNQNFQLGNVRSGTGCAVFVGKDKICTFDPTEQPQSVYIISVLNIFSSQSVILLPLGRRVFHGMKNLP